MSPLRGKKKKEEAEAEGQVVEEAAGEPSEAEFKPEELTPLSWFSRLTSLSDVQGSLHALPDFDMQMHIGNNLVRFVKKGLDKPTISEERSLRPDVVVRISENAWTELVKIPSLDGFANLYRKYAKTPSHEEFVKVTINKDSLLSNPGILRSKLFRNLFLV